MNKQQNTKLDFRVGSTVSFSKTVKEADIVAFAELTGDFSPNHMDEEFMKNSKYGKRIAHGALLVGYMSNTSTMIIENYETDEKNGIPVSLGYDRIRFLKPVLIDDTITVKYEVQEYDQQKQRSYAKIEITNQRNELVAVGTHILKWVPKK